MAAELDAVLDEIASIKEDAVTGRLRARPAWPMIVLRTPKVDLPAGDRRASRREQLACAPGATRQCPRHPGAHAAARIVDAVVPPGGPVRRVRRAASGDASRFHPRATCRMSANPSANGGLLREALRLPDFRDYAVEVPGPGTTVVESTHVLGTWLRDVIRDNPENFRLFGPDEVASNRLQAVYEVTDKQWNAELLADRRRGQPPRAPGPCHGDAERAPVPGLARGYLLTHLRDGDAPETTVFSVLMASA